MVLLGQYGCSWLGSTQTTTENIKKKKKKKRSKYKGTARSRLKDRSLERPSRWRTETAKQYKWQRGRCIEPCDSEPIDGAGREAESTGHDTRDQRHVHQHNGQNGGDLRAGAAAEGPLCCHKLSIQSTEETLGDGRGLKNEGLLVTEYGKERQLKGRGARGEEEMGSNK